MSSRPSTSAAGASTSGTSKPKPVKAGSNWKKLRKVRLFHSLVCAPLTSSQTLAPSSDEPSPKRRRPLPRSEPSSSSLRLDSPATGSPAPTTLPWFAEDLSPEDLALVRTAGTQAPQGALGVAETREEQRRKKAIILGGRKEDAEGKRE
jgi:RNA exonuclease 4